MTAEDAKQATDEALEQSKESRALAPLLEHVAHKIKYAAFAGKYFLTHPLRGFSGPFPTTEVERALWNRLKEEGYTIQHLPDPHPEDPRSTPYTKISWS